MREAVKEVTALTWLRHDSGLEKSGNSGDNKVYRYIFKTDLK